MKSQIGTNTSFDIYDIDGTLTKPGFDLWFECARYCAVDLARFDEAVALWKVEKTDDSKVYHSSLKMMRESISLTPSEFTGEDWKIETKTFVSNLIKEGRIFLDSIDFIKGRIALGYKAIFSTTNVIDGGWGFLEALVENGLITSSESEQIIVSGTEIDWKYKSVVHFNMAENKVVGITRKANIPYERIKAGALGAFGDDPIGNDKGILAIAKYPHVIANPKNEIFRDRCIYTYASWCDLSSDSFGR